MNLWGLGKIKKHKMADPSWPPFWNRNVIFTSHDVISSYCGLQRKHLWTYYPPRLIVRASLDSLRPDVRWNVTHLRSTPFTVTCIFFRTINALEYSFTVNAGQVKMRVTLTPSMASHVTASALTITLSNMIRNHGVEVPWAETAPTSFTKLSAEVRRSVNGLNLGVMS